MHIICKSDEQLFAAEEALFSLGYRYSGEKIHLSLEVEEHGHIILFCDLQNEDITWSRVGDFDSQLTNIHRITTAYLAQGG
jgi:hypothetical protein